MTMVKVENGSVSQVGLPAAERGADVPNLISAGWLPVKGTERPTETLEAGYQWTYGAPWSIEDGSVFGTWSKTQRPQPYPSWSWVDGQGWVAPVAKPDDGKDYSWDESAQAWVEDDLG